MPKPALILAAAVIAAVVGVAFYVTACGYSHNDASAPSTNVAITPPPLPSACGPNPAPAVQTTPDQFGYRQLISPTRDAPVSSPLRVAGQANPFEGAFTVTIFDRQGRRVATQDFTKDNRNLAFSVTLPFDVLQPMPACVWVHERSGRDGSPVNVTQVPVQLLP